jgi:hypothetical protein
MIRPCGKNRILETPAHRVLQCFAAQNLAILQNLSALLIVLADTPYFCVTA